MALAEENAGQYQRVQDLLKTYQEQQPKPLSWAQLSARLGKGFSRQTLYRAFYPETHGKDQLPETHRVLLEALIQRFKELLQLSVPPSFPLPDQASAQSKLATPNDRFLEFKLYYWDWNIAVPDAPSNFNGSVVTGLFYLPKNWQNSTKQLRPSKKKEFTQEVMLVLHDGVETEGELWVREHQPGKYDLSARFRRDGAPDLFLTLHIRDDRDLSLLVGAFTTADAEQHSPMHGTLYLRQVETAEKATLTSSSTSQPSAHDETDLMIRQALFQQTYVLKDKHTLPEFVKGAYKTLIHRLSQKTFAGYFIHTQEKALEHFRLKIFPDGHVVIVYHNGISHLGQFRSYHERLMWLAFDYDIKWGIHRYRMIFWKHPTQSDWYLGVGSGSEKAGMQIFMNRVAMYETQDTWDHKSVSADNPIPLNTAYTTDLNALFSKYPLLREYLSGEHTANITNNELLSETPFILQKAGLLPEVRPEETVVGLAGQHDVRLLKGNYLLYSLARETTPDGKDEWFEIVQMPLTIYANSTLEMVGDQKKYFGQMKREGERLVLQFTKRLFDGSDEQESTFMCYCLRLNTNDGQQIGHSIGTMVRFVSTMPEARTVIMVRHDNGEALQYKAYRSFSPDWVTLHGSDEGYVTRYFAGRINRILVPHDEGRKLPENRQKPFRQLYAYAALAHQDGSNHKEFVDYFHQAALHSFGEVEEDKGLFAKLKKAFLESHSAYYARWNKITKRKADELMIYIRLIDGA
ncbi:hypothetical protein DYU11_03350 [Fibrisoma montanum]|uniref:Uncharacterized protein n=1 Tax=Fibrisoma montanum TaxID=2305895 RepID=A0A418MIW7_9BACT|nr:hypothetical protein [Fibrisoma montanum]RIV27362.1 hypothetical protein DYU11_03350 [Fibrisoma montanum]